MDRPLRIYADTSIYGGCFDDAFESASRQFFRQVHEGQFHLIVSALVLAELGGAPDYVRAVLEDIPASHIAHAVLTDEMLALRDAYLEAKVVGPQSENDALHVAAATVLHENMILSWNFRHIVHYDKIRGFNAINRLRDYPVIDIFSPLEVIEQ